MNIADGVAIVTGGNRGIGAAFVSCLIESGVRKVYVGSRDINAASELLEKYPGIAVAVELDVTREDQVVAAAGLCGDVNVVINNAGVYEGETLIAASDMSSARQEMEVNYFGVLSMCRNFAPLLKNNGGGAIVNVLSAAAILPIPRMGGYSPSKFASRALTTCVRAELAEQGTQVSCLIVGSVDTRMAAHVQGRKESPEVIAKAGLKAIEKNIPEMDTDPFAINIRASVARDPALMERQMAAMLNLKTLSTSR